MNNLKEKFAALAAHRFAVPFVLLVVTLLAYGLSFWRLGFYWDDLPISWIRYELGTEGAARYFSTHPRIGDRLAAVRAWMAKVKYTAEPLVAAGTAWPPRGACVAAQ